MEETKLGEQGQVTRYKDPKHQIVCNDDDDDDDDDDDEDEEEEDDDSDDGDGILRYLKGFDKIPISEWLQANLPSSIHSEKSLIDWIHVASNRSTPSQINYHVDKDILGLLQAWEAVQESSTPITFELIKELAKKHGVTAGKWMFFAETGAKIDILWSKIATAVVEDKSTPFTTARVSTFSGSHRTHVVCIYSYDFTNKEELLELEKAIRDVGIKCRLQYKPDVYTIISVYKDNPWGLKPTVMESNFDLKSGSSVIKSVI